MPARTRTRARTTAPAPPTPISHTERMGITYAGMLDTSIRCLEAYGNEASFGIRELMNIIAQDGGPENVFRATNRFRASLLAAMIRRMRENHDLPGDVPDVSCGDGMPRKLVYCPIGMSIPLAARQSVWRRCWQKLGEGNVCPMHGDVTAQVKHHQQAGQLTPEQCERLGVGYTNNED